MRAKYIFMKNKVIVVTGTSRGIGLELTKLFIEKGFEVVSISRKINSDLENLRGCFCFSADITNKLSLYPVVTFLKAENKEVVGLVNNAGALVNKPFAALTSEDFTTMFNVNVLGVAHVNQAVLPFMKAKSHVVTISSMGGVQGSMKFPGLAAYSTSKGAVITLSELLAEEYKEQKIAFNVLALGAVQTEMLEEAFPGYQAPSTAKQMAEYILNFTLTGHQFYNAKVLQVSSSTP